MKVFIKKMLRESLINERLMNVDMDVDLIYNKYYKKDIEEIKSTGIITKEMFKIGSLYTSDLISDLAKKANKQKECLIIINFDKQSNYYRPKHSNISISINTLAVDFVLDNYNGNLKNAVTDLKLNGDITSSNSLMNEFNESKVKGSIHHELVHWIDDVLHNYHITNRLKKAGENNNGNTKNKLPINADKLEIQAQIHNIVQLKKEFIDIWDEMTFDDLLNKSSTLSLINSQLKGDIRINWVKNLKTRMYRENLLGKNMYNN